MSQPTNDKSVPSERRSRYFVDPKLQGALLWQAVWYWLGATATFVLISFVYRVVPASLSDSGFHLGVIWRDLGPYTLVSVTLFPLVMFCMVRFSNRFAGPMVRVRNTLKQLADGDVPERISLRDDDFWSDIACEINRISDRLREQKCDSDEGGDSSEIAHPQSSEPESVGAPVTEVQRELTSN